MLTLTLRRSSAKGEPGRGPFLTVDLFNKKPSMLRKLQSLLMLGPSLLALPAAAQDPLPESTESPSSAETPTDPLTAEPAAAPSDGQPSAPAEADTTHSTGASVAASGATSAVAAGTKTESAGDLETQAKPKKAWEFGFHGYFRAPIALGISNRPSPDNLTGAPETQISYGPNRTVDANYFSFAYTRLQEQDWVELFVSAKSKHAEATVGWMGYWLSGAGFRNPDAAWLPGIAYLTINTDFDVGKLRPNIALSGGAWWPKFGRHAKYDTYTLAQYRQIGEQLKLTIPFSKDITAALVQGFGTGRDGAYNALDPVFYQARVGLNLIEYVHLQFNYKDAFEIGLHQNMQWTRDPNLYLSASGEKTFTSVREASLMTLGAEVKVSVPYAGSLWVSPSLVTIKNGWALGQAGVEVVHGLSPGGLAENYLAWTGSPSDSTGSGRLFNLGFLYENTLASVLGKPEGAAPQVKFNAFGLLVDSKFDLPDGSRLPWNGLTQFKWGVDLEYNPWKWFGVMGRFDSVNYEMSHPGYIFSAVTARLSFYSDFFSGERIYLQYSRYRYGDNMTLGGLWPWNSPLVAGSHIIQGGVYAGSIPDMDVVKIQADIKF